MNEKIKKLSKKIAIIVLVIALMIPMMIFLDTSEAQTNKFTLYVGKTKTILLKDAVASKKVKWSISNKRVIKVVKKVTKGSSIKYITVMGKKTGKTKITATYTVNNKKKTVKCIFTIKSTKKPATETVQNSNSTTTQNSSNGTSNLSTTTNNNVVAVITPVPAGIETQVPVMETIAPVTTATPIPTATPKPTKTPIPTATPRFVKPETIPSSVDIELNKNNKYILNEYDMATLTFNNDGTLTIKYDEQWASVNFYLPDTAETYYSKYTSVTIEYTSIGSDLGYSLYDESVQFGEGRSSDDGTEPGKHPNWDKQITTGTNITKTFIVGSDFAGGCLRGINIFNPAESGTTTITIKKITFKK